MIRAVQQQDLPAILAIYNEAIENTTAVYTYQPHTLAMREAWLAEKEAASWPVLVYEEDGQVAGFATYGPFRAWPAYKYTIEHSVYVDAQFRGRQIASRLLAALMTRAESAGYATMVAGIDDDNEPSKRLHEKLGFAYAGTIHKAGYKFGRWLNLAFYQRQLAGPAVPNED